MSSSKQSSIIVKFMGTPGDNKEPVAVVRLPDGLQSDYERSVKDTLTAVSDRLRRQFANIGPHIAIVGTAATIQLSSATARAQDDNTDNPLKIIELNRADFDPGLILAAGGDAETGDEPYIETIPGSSQDIPLCPPIEITEDGSFQVVGMTDANCKLFPRKGQSVRLDAWRLVNGPDGVTGEWQPTTIRYNPTSGAGIVLLEGQVWFQDPDLSRAGAVVFGGDEINVAAMPDNRLGANYFPSVVEVIGISRVFSEQGGSRVDVKYVSTHETHFLKEGQLMTIGLPRPQKSSDALDAGVLPDVVSVPFDQEPTPPPSTVACNITSQETGLSGEIPKREIVLMSFILVLGGLRRKRKKD